MRWTATFPASVLLATIAAQEEPSNLDIAPIPRDEVRARHAAGKTLFDTRWVVDSGGRVVQFPNPAAGGSTREGLAFLGSPRPSSRLGPLPGDLRVWLRSWSNALPWLAASLRQPGDLLSAVDAERHRSQLGLALAPVAVRQELLTATVDASLPEPLQRRAVLEREVGVRLLQQTQPRAARGEFEVLRRAADPFLARAAADALAPSEPRTIAPATAWNATPPATGIDAWFWLDLRRMPARPEIAAAVLQSTAEDLWQVLLGLEGDPLNLALAGAQMIVDRPGEAAFELARCWGRSRIDCCLLGIAMLDGKPQLGWAAASGAFEFEVLRRHLLDHGFAVTDTGPVRNDAWWPGFDVTVTADRVLVRAHALAGAADGPIPTPIADALRFEAAFAAWLPVDSPIQDLPWLALERGESASVRLTPFLLRTTTTATDDRAVGTRWRRLAEGLATAATKPECARYLLEPTVRAWCDALRTPRLTTTGTGTIAEIQGAGLDPFALWPLLR